MFESLLDLPLARLKERILGRPGDCPENLLRALEQDHRLGARRLAQALRARKAMGQMEGRRLRNLLRFETELWSQGLARVAGVDEAGVGPLAGPVVAAAVILPRDYRLPGLNDSKQIAEPEKREELARAIRRDALDCTTALATVEEIDALNIYRASLLAMQRAVEALPSRPDFVLVDARTIPQCPVPQKGIVHGDALSASIAAASILAKTTRDAIMIEMDRAYPGYGFAAHKGYPTPQHCLILIERGPLPVHRSSFARVREILGRFPVQKTLFP